MTVLVSIRMILEERFPISKEGNSRQREATGGRSAAQPPVFFLRAFSGKNPLPDLVDFEFLHRLHDAVEIETGTAAAEPDDRDHLPANQ